MRMTLGAAVLMCACGVAAAAPPRGPLSEGREPDPVARDYYHGEPPLPPAEGAAPVSKLTASGWGLWDAVGEWLGEVSIPLGPLQAEEM